MINYRIEHYKDGSIPGSITLGVQVLGIPEYETAAFIFEDVRLVIDELEKDGSVGLESTLIYCDSKGKKFSIGKLDSETEAFMKELLTQIGTDVLKVQTHDTE